jgi:hypothetical protein
VLSDCWRAEERGKAIAIYSLAPFLGPVVGPIGERSEQTDWTLPLTAYLNSRRIHHSVLDVEMDILVL